jgi:Fe-S cluster biogenesis protein NfuA
MAQDTTLQKKIQRIGSLVEELESVADPRSRASAKELLESMMALHGAGLERILELATENGDSGNELIRRCGRDELVSSLLLLYGLHPDDLQTRVANALEKTRAFLESHAAHAELASIGDDAAVTVRLHQKAHGGCGSAGASVRSTLEAALQDAAPDASAIVIEEAGAGLAGFVSLAQLQSGQPLSALSVMQSQRIGD